MCVTAGRSLRMKADITIGQMMLVAPPNLSPTGTRGGSTLPWRWRPVIKSEDGAKKKTKQKKLAGNREETSTIKDGTVDECVLIG